MKKLVISLDSYSWIKYCSCLILENESEFQVMILYRESGIDGMFICPGLCAEAVKAQRKHDISRISKKLKIKRVMNMNYVKYIDIEHLSASISLQATFGNIQEIYYQNKKFLKPVIDIIGKEFGVKTYGFGNVEETPKKIIYSEKYRETLKEIKNIMLGINNKEQKNFPSIERFY